MKSYYNRRSKLTTKEKAILMDYIPCAIANVMSGHNDDNHKNENIEESMEENEDGTFDKTTSE